MRLTASRPEIHRRAASLFFSASFRSSPFSALFVWIRRLLPVAVVRLVVQRQHVLHAHQLGHHALEHLSFGFERLQLRTGRALEERASAGGELEPVAAFEGVVVRDDDPRLLDVLEQVVRDQLARAVVVVRVVRLQDAQAIADGQAGCDDEKAAGEVFAAGPANGVERLPGDQHRHDGRLAGPRGEFQREPLDLRIRVGVDRLQVVEQSFARRQMRRDFGKPDRRFDRLDLTEERTDAAELVMSPVLEKSRRLRRHLPLAGRQVAPRVDLPAHLVDDRREVVGLLLRRKALALVEVQFLLTAPTPLLGLRNRRDEFGAAASLEQVTSGLARLVELPMLMRVLVRRVDDGPVEERV